MQLPELPRQLNKREMKITPKVMRWLAQNWPRSAAVEIKMEDGKLEEHQIRALTKVQQGRFTYKIPDTGRRNPFDAILLKNADALIVRVYPSSRVYKCVIEHNGHLINFTI